MENIFFLILVAIVGLIRWLSQAAENKRNAEAERRSAPPATAVPSAPMAPSTEEERVRKFFEALGVPVGTAPSPKAPPRRVVTPKAAPADRKFMPVDPFPVPRGRATTPPSAPTTPPPLPVAPAPAPQITRPAQITVSKKAAIEMPRSMTSSEFEVQDFDAFAIRSNAESPSESSLVGRLATGQGLRDAIILREIFGPPLSMQPLTRTTVG